MTSELTGRVAVVTGTAGGIGAGIADALGSDGLTVSKTGIRAPFLEIMRAR